MKIVPQDQDEWAELATRAAAGNPQAMRSLCEQLLPRVRNLVRYLIRGDRDVDDLSQDALVSVLQGLGSFRGDGAFGSWADRVVARSVFRNLKQARRDLPKEATLEDVASPTCDMGDGYVQRRRMVALLDQLSDAQRNALVMHHVLGLTAAEISVELSIPEETVRSRLKSARAQMRALLEHDSRRVG